MPRAVPGLWVGHLCQFRVVKRRGDKGTVQWKEGAVTFIKHLISVPGTQLSTSTHIS